MKLTDITLKIINTYLRPLENLLVKKFSVPQYPVVFIVGPPRCGSTLLQQILSQRFDIGYICNLQAKFWLIPYIGACLTKKIRPETHSTDFTSKYGNTSGLWEPHEWGWFWREVFNIDEETGLCRNPGVIHLKLELLKKNLAALEEAYEAPLIFDNVYTLPYIHEISCEIKTSLFIYLKRAPFYIANSILNARLKRYGDISKWYGHIPEEFDEIIELPPVEQCVAQVHRVENDIKKNLDSIDRKKVLHVEYDNVCANPEDVARSILNFVGSNGFRMKKKYGVVPREFKNRNTPEMVNPIFREELVACYERYFC